MKMAEYIKREDVGLSDFEIVMCNGDYKEALKMLLEKVEKIPSADVVERKRGKWVGYPECLKYMNAYADDHIVCSACEECFSILDNDCERFNFCPNCGADMREESER